MYFLWRYGLHFFIFSLQTFLRFLFLKIQPLFFQYVNLCILFSFLYLLYFSELYYFRSFFIFCIFTEALFLGIHNFVSLVFNIYPCQNFTFKHSILFFSIIYFLLLFNSVFFLFLIIIYFIFYIFLFLKLFFY